MTASFGFTLFRLVRTVPCMAAFMSSLTVISVAMDRHRVIVRPHMNQVELHRGGGTKKK